MRPSLFFLVALSVSGVHASWFGSDSPRKSSQNYPSSVPLINQLAYSSWSRVELQQWLNDHSIKTPPAYSTSQLRSLVKSNWVYVQSSADAASAWTQDQYTKAQKSFRDVKEASFESWDESRLREFLLEQGVVAPSGPREQLVLLAKQKYRGYNEAGSSLSAQASKTAGGYMSSASSLGVTASTTIAQATKDAVRKMDDGKDYVYSTWDEGKLRKYLEDKGVVDKKASSKLTKQQLLEKMRGAYASVTEPIWDSWSDSYMVRPVLLPFSCPN